MKLLYFSTTSFADCDLDLLKSFRDKFEKVKYVLISPVLRKNDFDVDYFKEYCSGSGIDFEPFVLKRRRRNPLNIFSYLSLLYDLRIRGYDCVYFNNYDELFLNGLLPMFFKRTNTIIAFHDVVNHSGLDSMALRISKKILFSCFSNFLTFSKSQKIILKKKLSKKKRVFAIPLALKNFGKPTITKPPKTTTNFLFFGNIKSYKGLDILINGLNELPPGLNYKLFIAGRCDNWIDYENMIGNNNKVIANIGFIPFEDIPNMFHEAHFLVLPYRDVTQSGPLMIAYNYSVPVIASNLDGFVEYIELGKNGFVFEREVVNSIQAEIQKAIFLKQDEYDEIVRNLEDYVNRNFSVDNLVALYQEMFESLK